MRRGNNWSNNTSEGQFKAMEQEFAQAVPYANAAMALNPRSALPHTVLQVIASAQFDYKSVQAILAEALRADPKTMAARAIAITRLAPKWGGNFETIQDVVQGAAKANLPDDQINYLVYSAFSERGGQFWMDKDYEKAAFSYGRAVKLCANSSHAVNGYVASAALAKDWDAIIAEVTRLEKAGLVYAQAFRRRGQAYEARKEMDLAVKDFERAVALGEPWSASKLGYMYATGTHVPKNMEKARSLFAMAASQGDFYSQQYLERLNRQDSKSLPPVSGAEAMQPKLTQ
jgi:TPR repeat protein